MKHPLLLVDDDPECADTVSLALGSDYEILTAESLHEALNFLRTRLADVRGVIVDLNLTNNAHDNFGRQILERLRDNGMPAIVFSANVRGLADAERLQSEFGVVAIIGKGDSSVATLGELRDAAALLVTLSLERQVAFLRRQVDSFLVEEGERLDARARRIEQRTRGVARAAGSRAGDRLRDAEQSRLMADRARLDELAASLRQQIASINTYEDYSSVAANISARVR